jgi:hypothetical protein
MAAPGVSQSTPSSPKAFKTPLALRSTLDLSWLVPTASDANNLLPYGHQRLTTTVTGDWGKDQGAIIDLMARNKPKGRGDLTWSSRCSV